MSNNREYQRKLKKLNKNLENVFSATFTHIMYSGESAWYHNTMYQEDLKLDSKLWSDDSMGTMDHFQNENDTTGASCAVTDKYFVDQQFVDILSTESTTTSRIDSTDDHVDSELNKGSPPPPTEDIFCKVDNDNITKDHHAPPSHKATKFFR